MARAGYHPKMANFLKCGIDGDERVLENTTFTSHSAYTDYATEDREEYDRLRSEGHQHVVFTDRENIPDMKLTNESQKFYHIHGSATNTGTEIKLVSSILPCSCDNCLSNHEDTNVCLYKHLNPCHPPHHPAYLLKIFQPTQYLNRPLRLVCTP